MRNRHTPTTFCWLSLLLVMLSVSSESNAQDLSETIAEAAGIPNIPAFLPDRYTVPKTRAMPIDGVYMISTIRKKVRIEAGRVFAMDGWLHMFVLKVQPDMVVMQNFRRVKPGQYQADDLPLLGTADLNLTRNGDLNVTVQSKFGPVRYNLIKLEEQYPDVFRKEMRAAHNIDIGSASDANFDDFDFGDGQSESTRYRQSDYDDRERDDRYRDDEYRDRQYRDERPRDDRYRDDRYEDDRSSDNRSRDERNDNRYRDDRDADDDRESREQEDCVPINIDPETGRKTCA
ncbi:MAG: hypothetical protein AAGA33_05775 [Pseudomonadota bacterium]